MRYTKYICEKVPLSEPKFSQDLLLLNYAVLPKQFPANIRLHPGRPEESCPGFGSCMQTALDELGFDAV